MTIDRAVLLIVKAQADRKAVEAEVRKTRNRMETSIFMAKVDALVKALQ